MFVTFSRHQTVAKSKICLVFPSSGMAPQPTNRNHPTVGIFGDFHDLREDSQWPLEKTHPKLNSLGKNNCYQNANLFSNSRILELQCIFLCWMHIQWTVETLLPFPRNGKPGSKRCFLRLDLPWELHTSRMFGGYNQLGVSFIYLSMILNW